MKDNINFLLREFKTSELREILIDSKIGLEKESLRMLNSCLSKQSHQKAIGSSLCNRFITTDFSESQLELVTPAFKHKESLIDFLENLHHFVTMNINMEFLWPFSMPPFFASDAEIPIAKYGSSNIARFKELYREGLSNRYGRRMQAISGIHLNYSFSESIWKIPLFFENKSNFKIPRSDGYMKTLRNMMRLNWLVIYLFGASPIISRDQSHQDDEFLTLDEYTSYLPYATSLRMSDLGYQNSLRNTVNVSTDSLNQYLSDIREATTSESKEFSIFEKKQFAQINPNFLQIDDEYYSTVRPKSNKNKYMRTTSNLKKFGIDYLELRSIDLNPYSSIGITQDAIMFIDILFIYCLFQPDIPIDSEEQMKIYKTESLVSKKGRMKNLFLYKNNEKILLSSWANEIFEEMMPIAEILDGPELEYSEYLKNLCLRINEPETTPSASITNELIEKNMSFLDLAKDIGEKNRQSFLAKDKIKNSNWDEFERESLDSLDRQYKLEKTETSSLNDYLNKYFGELSDDFV